MFISYLIKQTQLKWNIILILLLPFLGIAGQENKVYKILDAIYIQAHLPDDNYIDESILFKPANQSIVFKRLESWLVDTSTAVRCRAVSLSSGIGQQTEDSLLRRAVVTRLANCCKDTTAGITGMAASFLTHYDRSDFEQMAKDTLLSCLNPEHPAFIPIMKLTGYLQISEARSILLTLYSQNHLDERSIWAIQFTLARLGDQRSAKICALIAKQTPLNNAYVNILLPDLIYTRNKFVYDELVAQLNKDETGCLSPNPNYGGNIPCSYRILEAFSGTVAGYPLQTNRYGDLIHSNYPQALLQAREWFSSNVEYTIVDNSY